jgi:hypothetical protein
LITKAKLYAGVIYLFFLLIQYFSSFHKNTHNQFFESHSFHHQSIFIWTQFPSSYIMNPIHSPEELWVQCLLFFLLFCLLNCLLSIYWSCVLCSFGNLLYDYLNKKGLSKSAGTLMNLNLLDKFLLVCIYIIYCWNSSFELAGIFMCLIIWIIKPWMEAFIFFSLSFYYIFFLSFYYLLWLVIFRFYVPVFCFQILINMEICMDSCTSFGIHSVPIV